MVQNLREVSVHDIIILPVRFRKIHIAKIHENELNILFIFTEVKLAEVVM